MKKVMLLLALIAVVVLLFAPVATAKQHKGTDGATATATAMTATPGAEGDKLPRTGGSTPVLAITLLASLTLIGSGVVALSLRRRGTS
jgi:hypothetical protein